MDHRYAILIPFLDESPSFTNGFECGKIWELLTRNEAVKEMLVHVANQEQIVLMFEHFGYTYQFREVGDDCWMFMTAEPVNIEGVLQS